MKTLHKWIVAVLAAALCHAAGADVFYKFVPSNGVMKGSATSPVTQSAAAADILGLWTGTCSLTTLLHGAGACGKVDLTTDVTSTLPLANGGIGATSLAAAFIPAFSGSITSGHCVQWLTSTTIGDAGAACGAGAGTPASPTNSVQFNNAGAFGGSSNFRWDNTNGILTVGGASGGFIDAVTGENLTLAGGNALSDLTSATCSINVGGGLSGAGGGVTCNAGNAVTSGAGGSIQINAGNPVGTNQAGGTVTISATAPTGVGGGGTIALVTHGVTRELINDDGGITNGSPTGASKGAGTYNATGLFVQGSAVAVGAMASCAANVSGTTLTLTHGLNCSSPSRAGTGHYQFTVSGFSSFISCTAMSNAAGVVANSAATFGNPTVDLQFTTYNGTSWANTEVSGNFFVTCVGS